MGGKQRCGPARSGRRWRKWSCANRTHFPLFMPHPSNVLNLLQQYVHKTHLKYFFCRARRSLFFVVKQRCPCTRLKASLNMDRHYASPKLGGTPASLRRRHATSTQPSDFLDDGTPATPQGAMQTFGREGPPLMDEQEDIRKWKEGRH